MCPCWPSKTKPPRLKDAESSFETGRVLPSPPVLCLPQLPQAAGKGAAEGRAKQRWARGRSWCCIIAWQPRGWSLKSKTEGGGEKRSSSFTWKSSCLPGKLQSCFLTCIRNVPLLSQGLGNSAALAGSPCPLLATLGPPARGRTTCSLTRADPRGPDPATGHEQVLELVCCSQLKPPGAASPNGPRLGFFIQASAISPLLGAAGGSHAGKLLGAGDQEPSWGRQGSSLHAPPWKRLQSPAGRSQIQIALPNEFGEANLGALAEGGGGFMRFR